MTNNTLAIPTENNIPVLGKATCAGKAANNTLVVGLVVGIGKTEHTVLMGTVGDTVPVPGSVVTIGKISEILNMSKCRAEIKG